MMGIMNPCNTRLSFAIVPWIAMVIGCADLTNDPITDIHLLEGKTYTTQQAKANQTVSLRFDATAEGSKQIIQLRMWSLGQLAGVDVHITGPNGQVVWTGSSAGTELLTPALQLPGVGQYTATIRWIQGEGHAGYHYSHLYSGESPLTGREQMPLEHGRYGHTTTVLSDGQVLAVGGDDNASTQGHRNILASDTAEVLNTETGQPTATEALNHPRAFHTATRIEAPLSPMHGHVFVAGGLSPNGASRETEIFNPETNTFEPGPKLPGARAYQSAVAVGGTGSFLDGTVVLVGGENTRTGPQHDLLEGLYNEVDENPTNLPTDAIKKPERSSLWYFRPGDDTIKRVGQEMTYGRVASTVTLLQDGRILILGGGVDSLPTAPGCSTNTLGCRCSDSVPLCTQFQCPGGDCDDSQYTNYVRKDVATDLVEVYNTSTGELSVLKERMKKARIGHSATVLPNGNVLIVGGATAHRRNFKSDEGGLLEYPRSLDSVELFDPTLNTFRLLSPLAIPREGHAAAVMHGTCESTDLPCVLIAGGQRGVPGGLAPVTALSFFDAETEDFTVRDISAQSRLGATHVALTAQQLLLIVGGASTEGLVPDTQSVEILQWAVIGAETP